MKTKSIMKKLPIYIFIISLFWGGVKAFAQTETNDTVKPDTIYYPERYGLRLGADLSKIGRSLLDKKYEGFEILGDFRILDRFYIAGELGYESFESHENNFNAKSDGGYFKVGVNYNAYINWIGMQNEIYAGLRYGISTFSETLNDYVINERDHYFPPNEIIANQKYSGLSAHWAEFQIGIKAEVLHNLYLGIHAELKRIITSKQPDNFQNLWIPGYNRVYDHSDFGMGWGYSVSYLIPILKKEKTQELH